MFLCYVDIDIDIYISIIYIYTYLYDVLCNCPLAIYHVYHTNLPHGSMCMYLYSIPLDHGPVRPGMQPSGTKQCLLFHYVIFFFRGLSKNTETKNSKLVKMMMGIQ